MRQAANVKVSPEEIAQFGKAIDALLAEIEEADSRIRRNQSELGRLKRRPCARFRPLQAAA